ncbi:hypothetical protein TNCV_2072921 [Trichonephila clavipes]|nr:hypothetical protein TNCV_2072921 [Trichonephila clavipes]
MDRLCGIRFWDYKRENFRDGKLTRGHYGGIFKGSVSDLRGVVLSDMMMILYKFRVTTCILENESELQVIEADIQSMEDRLEELEVRIRDILNSLIAKSSVSSAHNHENAISQTNSKLKLEIKLPEIPLPVFRGRYDE